MNHLYLQTAFLGDLLLSVPTLKQLRYLDPKSHITLVCRRGYGPFMEELGLCDEVIELEKGSKFQLVEQLKGRSFENIFCPHQSLTSHRLVRGIKAKCKVGYKKSWNHSFFDIRVKRELIYPEAIRQLQLIAPLYDSMAVKMDAFAIKQNSIPNWAQMGLPHLHWSLDQIENMAAPKVQGFKVAESYVCVAPGSVWPTKRWPLDKFTKVCVDLARFGYQVAIMGAPDERDLCEALQKQTPNSFNFSGHLSIMQSLMMLSKAKGLICNDSGAMHMASLLELPTVSLFGPTVKELGYKPWNPKGVVLENSELLCRPCGQHGARHCPIGTHQCMTSIESLKVVEQAQELFR